MSFEFMTFEAWDCNDHRLEGTTRDLKGRLAPVMVMPPTQAVHAEPVLSVRRPAFPQPPDGFCQSDQSWGISCAHTAIIPTNSAIDASAAASSTKVLNMARLP